MPITEYETDIQKVYRKQGELENLYKALDRKIESNSSYIGRIKDDMYINKKERVESISKISKEIDNVSMKMATDINAVSDKVGKYFNRMDGFERNMEQQIKCIDNAISQKHTKWISQIEEIKERLVLKVDSMEDKIARFTQQMNQGQVNYISKINAKHDLLECKINDNAKDHRKHIHAEIEKFNQHYIKILESLDKNIFSIKDEVKKFQYLKKEVKEINSKNKEDLIDSVNGRLNNFKDDIDRMLLLDPVSDEKGLLRHIARLEGVRDAVGHRKSTKELLTELEEAKLALLKSERNGSVDSTAKSKVDTLMWILGRKQ